MGAFFGFFASLLSRLFTFETLRFLAYKVLLTGLVFTGLLIVYQYVLKYSIELVINLAQQYLPKDSVVLAFSGLAGWLMIHLRVPECASLLFSAYSVRVVLRVLPFSPWRS